jgi:hypothetical protein
MTYFRDKELNKKVRSLKPGDVFIINSDVNADWVNKELIFHKFNRFTDNIIAEDPYTDEIYKIGITQPRDEEFDIELIRPLEEDMGGVSAPMATLTNTPGVGTAQPAATADMTTTGSGDSWGDSSIGMQTNENQEYGDFYIEDLDHLANKEFGLDFNQLGQGEKEWVFDELAKPDSEMFENNLNPYDKIGAMMAKKMGVPQPFKKKDSKTNTIEQVEIDEDAQKQHKFKIYTLDNYAKASKHIKKPKKKSKKKINEEDLRDENALKDVKAKSVLEELGISFKYKPGKSGKMRVFITEPMKDVLEKLKTAEWEEYGRNPENTIRKYKNNDKILTIYADGKELPRATLTSSDIIESIKIKKLVSNSIDPYLNS